MSGSNSKTAHGCNIRPAIAIGLSEPFVRWFIFLGHDYPRTESSQSSSFALSVAKGRGGPFFFKSGGSALRGLAVDIEEEVKVEGDTVERIAETPVRGEEGSLIGVDDDGGGGVGEVAVLALP